MPPKTTLRAAPEDDEGTQPKSLEAILEQSGRPLALPELARAAGVDANDVDQIEHFYLRLRAEVGNGIAVADAEAENPSLDVAAHAP